MLRKILGKKPPPSEIDGVRVRASKKARRLSLRVDLRGGDIVLTWPRNASEKTARAFIEEHRHWIASRRQKIEKPGPLAEEGRIYIHGEAYEIVRQTGRGVACLKEGKLIIYGAPEHQSRRLRDFLKKTAAAILAEKAAEKLERLRLKPAPIRVIDPRTRWGSCSPDGRMMFSWRLILAPPNVLDYVVAHEVAHRLHMNHSRKFWDLCRSLTADADGARRWLRTHGTHLMLRE